MILARIVVGALLGFGWYKLVGCPTGACPLSSNPYVLPILGGVLGLVTGLN